MLTTCKIEFSRIAFVLSCIESPLERVNKSICLFWASIKHPLQHFIWIFDFIFLIIIWQFDYMKQFLNRKGEGILLWIQKKSSKRSEIFNSPLKVLQSTQLLSVLIAASELKKVIIKKLLIIYSYLRIIIHVPLFLYYSFSRAAHHKSEFQGMI